MVALVGGPERSVGQAGRARQDGFRGWWFVAERAVWSDRIVVLSPLLDQDAGFLQRIEDLPVQELVPELAVKALIIAVLQSRTA